MSEAAKSKPADVIVKSLEESPAAAGLRALGARPKSVGQHRVVLTGIPDRVVETPEHPDNPRAMWRSYRKRPSRFDPIYSEEFFMNLDGLWKTMWKNVIKNMPDLKVPGKRNLDTASELAAKGVDHTSGLDAEGLRNALIDADSMPGMDKILDELSDLVDEGWNFVATPKVNHISLVVETPREAILGLYNLPLKGAQVKGRVSPYQTHFSLALEKNKSGKPYELSLFGNEKDLAAQIRQQLQSRFRLYHEIDLMYFTVNGQTVPGNLKKPFLEYADRMKAYIKTIPIEDLQSGAKIIDEAKIGFRSEDGSVLLAFLDEKFGMEPKARALEAYRKEVLDAYEEDPDAIEKFAEGIPARKRDEIFGPDLVALFKSKKLII